MLKQMRPAKFKLPVSYVDLATREELPVPEVMQRANSAKFPSLPAKIAKRRARIRSLKTSHAGQHAATNGFHGHDKPAHSPPPQRTHQVTPLTPEHLQQAFPLTFCFARRCYSLFQENLSLPGSMSSGLGATREVWQITSYISVEHDPSNRSRAIFREGSIIVFVCVGQCSHHTAFSSHAESGQPGGAVPRSQQLSRRCRGSAASPHVAQVPSPFKQPALAVVQDGRPELPFSCSEWEGAL